MTIEEAKQIVEQEGIDQDTLDDVVHDMKAQEASSINNGGIDEQIAYIIGTLDGLSDKESELRRILK